MPTKIPRLDHLDYPENLATISLLEAQGYRGIDASLSESVFHYGFVWRELPVPLMNGDDFLFIYEIESHPQSFDNLSLSSTRHSLEHMFRWVDWEDLAKMHGMDLGAWHAQPFPQKIFDLYNVYGYENVFGSSHWGGFKIADT